MAIGVLSLVWLCDLHRVLVQQQQYVCLVIACRSWTLSIVRGAGQTYKGDMTEHIMPGGGPQRTLLLVTTVDIGDGRDATISVYDGDSTQVRILLLVHHKHLVLPGSESHCCAGCG